MGRIVHPTDLGETSWKAFEHALWLAYFGGHELVILHVSGNSSHHANWIDFPRVRKTLAKWGFDNPETSETDPANPGIAVSKIDVSGSDVVEMVLGYLGRHQADLLVVGSRGFSGLEAWLHSSISLRLATEVKLPVLFVRDHTTGFIGSRDGRVGNVLVPIDHEPDPQLAIDWIANMPEIWKLNVERITALHVGTKPISPPLVIRNDRDVELNSVQLTGTPVKEIQMYCKRHSPDLLVMIRVGPDKITERFLGSTSERIIANVDCPVLAIPAPSYD